MTANGTQALAREDEPSTGTRARSTRTLPHDAGAERHVLGACLLDSDYWATVGDAVVAEDFYEPRNRIVFEAMRRLAAQGYALDTVSLGDALVASGQLQAAGGHERLLALTDTIPTSENVEQHCERIVELATVRKVYAAAASIANEALQPIEHVGDFLDGAETLIALAGERRRNVHDPVHVRKAVGQMLDAVERRQDRDEKIGFASGLVRFDSYMGGSVPGEVVVIAGRPGMGKTAFALRVALGVAQSSKLPVLFFSLEMPKEQLCMRLVSMEGSIPHSRIRGVGMKFDTRMTPDDRRLARAKERELENVGLYIEDSPFTTILDVRRTARRFKRKHGGLALIVIDYLQLLRPMQRGRTREEEVADSSRLTKALAKELQVGVHALAQLNRGPETRGTKDKRPGLADLRESGAIEQDADGVVFVYRDEVYDSESKDKGIAEIIIGKQRSGATGVLKFAFRKEYTRFDNLAEQQDAWSNSDDDDD